MNDDKLKTPKEKETDTIRITFSMIIAVAATLIEIYFMLNYTDYLWAAVFALIILVAVGIFTAEVVKFSKSNKKTINEEYEKILKSEKATYIMLKKNLAQIDQKFEELKDVQKNMMREINSNERSVGKVIITKTKENMKEAMGSFSSEGSISTDQISALLNQFEDKIKSDINGLINEKENNIKQLLKESEFAIRESVMNRPQAPVMSYSAPPTNMAASVPMPEATIPQEVELKMQAPTEDMSAFEEDITGMADLDTMADIQPEITPETEAAAELEPMPEPEVAAEPEPMPEPEVAAEPEVEAEPEPAPEPEIAAAEPEPEPAEEKPPMPDMSDPNKIMSPEDIAALLANM